VNTPTDFSVKHPGPQVWGVCTRRVQIEVTPINEEPRVLDTALAEALGMIVPRIVRTVIQANAAELESFGKLLSQPTVSGKRGPIANAFYLNEEQALLVCLLSRTERAKQVRAEVIRVAEKGALIKPG
jgi:hypothetical protein